MRMSKKKNQLVSRMAGEKRIYGQERLRELIAASFTVSKTSFDMNEAIQNLKTGVVSSVIDLSDF